MTSIIIPVYNVEQYLDACVESARKLNAQIEIILVDDGSTDHSGMLCDAWAEKDTRIRVIHQKNGGLSAARNTGIQNARGEYVLFLDSDDFLDPAATEKLLACQNSDADVLLGLYHNYYTEQDRYEPENSPAFLEMSGLVSMEQFLPSIPKDGQSCFMVAVRFVVKRSLLIEENLWFMPGIYHEDEEWTQRLLCHVKNIYISHAYFYQYRQARMGAITSVVRPQNVWDIITILEHAFQEQEKYRNVKYKHEYLCYRAAQAYLDIMMKSKVLDQGEKRKIWRILEVYRRRCLPYLCGTVGKLARLLIVIFGIPNACVMLQGLRKIVRAVEK